MNSSFFPLRASLALFHPLPFIFSFEELFQLFHNAVKFGMVNKLTILTIFALSSNFPLPLFFESLFIQTFELFSTRQPSAPTFLFFILIVVLLVVTANCVILQCNV